MEGSKYEKECKWCGIVKPLDQFYSHNKKKANGEKYLYHHPECKECTMINSTKWRKEHPERYKVFYTNRNQKPYFKEKMKIAAKKQLLEGKQREWQRNNPEKLKEYALKRQNKIHVFTDEEWLECKDYFNYECAYCGLHESENLILYKHHLHREHVIHDGSNDIENCVPACVWCNVSKSDNEFIDWYNESNPNFSKRRLNKIIKWTTKDFHLVTG